MKRLRPGKPIAVDGLTVIPVESTVVGRIETGHRFGVYASKAPVGVVICSPEGLRALDVQGRTASVETFVREVEGLKQILDDLCYTHECL